MAEKIKLNKIVENIVVDIGGTKVLLAAVDNNSLIEITSYKSSDYNSFEDLLDNYLDKLSNKNNYKINLKQLSLAVAGPVINNNSKLTNLSWDINSKDIVNKYSINNISVVNDLEAIAAEIISSDNLICINNICNKLFLNKNIAIVAPGTGLGVAYAVFNKSGYIINSTEGGHIDFAARDNLQIELFNYIKNKYNINKVNIELICSGIGIANIFDFFINYKKLELTNYKLDDIFDKDLVPYIINNYKNNSCEACVKTINLFLEIFAGVLQTVALIYMSTGGIYLSGGIAMALSSVLTDNKINKSFLEIFYTNNSMSHILKQIPIYLSLDKNIALKGALKFIL